MATLDGAQTKIFSSGDTSSLTGFSKSLNELVSLAVRYAMNFSSIGVGVFLNNSYYNEAQVVAIVEII
jgi:hypothetical protein